MVSLLLITHGYIGHELIKTANGMLGQLPLHALALAIHNDVPLETHLHQARDLFQQINCGDGVLILTDMYGSTPSNVAESLLTCAHGDLEIVAGVSLPMLVRVLNYSHLDLLPLTQKALGGGHDGIIHNPMKITATDNV
jgi:mannose PTS system EIIA component